ncbi:metallophosphoesterase [Vibrio sp. SCSIO 43132]|uniref:metallophosphoesterase family protein n=1 Tax=Vibrio sp. SCSIO 43132 TaxID=2779363 RepID=UPI001CA9793A|nr:metallophosphoesterase [Vibrio sp. SCSIO 43132]UAB72216.1 metallophosphoesterase [Vibrio sp. SCSIO 43132]
MKILHITDMHIKSATNHNEALRKAFYGTYLKSFIEQIKNESIEKIFITGDFILAEKNDTNIKSKFEHAHEIISFLLEHTNLSNRDVFITNGNHDVIRDTGCLSDYKDFERNFNHDDDLLDETDYFKLYRVNKIDAVLCLNSIGKNHKTGYPNHCPSEKQSDAQWLDSAILRVGAHKIENLYVLSHHPVTAVKLMHRCSRDENKEGKSWFDKHVWLLGNLLLERLKSNHSISGSIYCFSGDVHLEEFSCDMDQYYSLVTGSFNYIQEWDTDIPSQATVFSTLNNVTAKLYYYNLLTHNSGNMDGVWEHRSLKMIRTSDSCTMPTVEKTETLIINNDSTKVLNDVKETANVPVNKYDKNSVQLNFVPELDSDIIDFIKDNNLYKFGRFSTHKDSSSLVWVSVGRILTHTTIFSDVIESFRLKFKEIEKENPHNNNCDYLFVGLNNLGGALATRLGAGTNIRSCCVGYRDSYDEVEAINERLKSIICRKKHIIFVSDVVATGETLVSLKRKLGITHGKNVYSFVVLFDPNQNRLNYLNEFKDTYTVCSSFKMPVLDNDVLPEKDVFAPEILLI